MRSPRETRALVLLTLVTLVWAGLMPTGKVALRSVPPLTIAAIRMTLGSLMLYSYLRRDTLSHYLGRRVGVTELVRLALVGALASYASKGADVPTETVSFELIEDVL